MVAPMKRLLMLAAVGLFVRGCARLNVNPAQARAKTGYVEVNEQMSYAH